MPAARRMPLRVVATIVVTILAAVAAVGLEATEGGEHLAVHLVITAAVATATWWLRGSDAVPTRTITGRTTQRRTNRTLRTLAEHIPVGICAFEADGRLRWANAATRQLLDPTVADQGDIDWDDLVHPDDVARARRVFDDAVADVDTFRVRHRGRVDGLWIEQTGAPVAGARGRVEGVFVLITDISDLVAFEDELTDARDAALAASRMKSEFLASMSHEIRTPLNGVIGMADVLLATGLTQSQQSKLGTLRTAAIQLRDLLSDILDLSKIEAGHMQIEQRTFDPRTMVDGIVRLHAAEAIRRSLELRVDVHPDVPDRVQGAQLRVRQVLNNLIGNAIKFTEHGGVAIDVTCADRRDDQVLLCYTVTDSGVGIPESALPSIFDPFTQADSTTTRRFGGTGLGLAICQKLVTLMGGDISVHSEEGRGSMFSFQLPMTVAARPAAGAPAGAVERRPGATASTRDDEARDGATAPAGDDEATATPELPPPASAQPHVLVVEDNLINQEVAVELLGALGCTVDLATDGVAALDAVAGRDYDVVFMDCQMPRMDGFEATRRIRAAEDESGGRVPVVAMTAFAMTGDDQRCYEAGMDDYIAKPVSRANFDATLRRWAGDALASDQHAATEAADDGPPPVIDWQALHQLSVVPGLLQRSRQRFIEHGTEEIAELLRLVEAGRLEQARALAHKLKGSSGTMGAARLAAELGRIEAAWRDGRAATTDELPNDAALAAHVEHLFVEAREALLAAADS